MKTPEYTGMLLSTLAGVSISPDTSLWSWSAKNDIRTASKEETSALLNQGYISIQGNASDQISSVLITSPQYEVIWLTDDNAQGHPWVHTDALAQAKQAPVNLLFDMDDTSHLSKRSRKLGRVDMLQFLPPPNLGRYGAIQTGNEVKIYPIDHLPARSRQLFAEIAQAVRELAAPGEWIEHTELHTVCADLERFEAITQVIEWLTAMDIGNLDNYYATGLNEVLKRGDVRAAGKALAAYQEASQDIKAIRQSLSRPDWLEKWEGIVRMYQQLSEDYNAYHLALTKSTPLTPLPEIRASDRTRMPSSNGFRGLVQSFGPGLQHSLWNEETSTELQLKTPNNSLLMVKGKNEIERTTLHQYVSAELGVEGLKHVVAILHAYYAQTGAQERKDDAEVTPYQLLRFMGYDDKNAGNTELQRDIVKTLLYLSRTWVVSQEVEYVMLTRNGRQRRRKGVEWSPLIVLETLKSSEDGGFEIPERIEYHLGKEFYSQLFGDHQQYYMLPTADMLRYHGKNEQQEICLSFYLTNFITINAGTYIVHFPELLEGSAIRLEDDIKRGVNRTRDALRTLYALEHLQRDGWFTRDAHEDIDAALAVEYYTKQCDQDALSPETFKRIKTSYAYFQGKALPELRKIRRQALQHLLNTTTSLNKTAEGKTHAITFHAGALLQKQADKVTAGRQRAIERTERMMVARATKLAGKRTKKNIVDADQ